LQIPEQAEAKAEARSQCIKISKDDNVRAIYIADSFDAESKRQMELISTNVSQVGKMT
jgi:hypothetical protein